MNANSILSKFIVELHKYDHAPLHPETILGVEELLVQDIQVNTNQEVKDLIERIDAIPTPEHSRSMSSLFKATAIAQLWIFRMKVLLEIETDDDALYLKDIPEAMMGSEITIIGNNADIEFYLYGYSEDCPLSNYIIDYVPIERYMRGSELVYKIDFYAAFKDYGSIWNEMVEGPEDETDFEEVTYDAIFDIPVIINQGYPSLSAKFVKVLIGEYNE